MSTAMNRRMALGTLSVVLMCVVPTTKDNAAEQARTRVSVTRLYTGPDNQSHFEEIEVAFSSSTAVGIAQLMKTAGAELRRTPAGNVQDWHTASRRQYIITLSGHTQIEVAGGKKLTYGPGHISLVEDTTGKGHLTRVVGAEDVVSVVLPLAEPAAK